MSVNAVAESGTAKQKGLRSGALGLLGSVVVGTASVAPAYSLAASLGLVVAAGAGLKAPAIILLAFLPMFCIAMAYKELNSAEPDCGTTFTWSSRAFGPRSGWMGGWMIIASDVIVMANLAAIAGSYSFELANQVGLHNTLSSSTLASTIAGVAWIAIMAWICYRGIEFSAKIQYVLLGIELLTLLVFAGTALFRVFAHHAVSTAVRPSFSWLLPTGMSAGTLASALLIAVFIYWGWDSAVASNEETDDPGRTPGRAALLSTVLLLITYLVVTYAAVAFAGVGTDGIGLGNPTNAADVFAAIGPALYGDSFIGHLGMGLLSISILTSSALSTQTTILPTARTALSMATHGAMPKKFATIAPKFLTPTWSTLGMGVLSIAFFLGMTAISPSILLALIGAIGLLIALYYGMTGFACVWLYRRTLTSSPRNLMMRGVLPMFGGLSLMAMFGFALVQYAKPDYLVDDAGNNVTLFGIGAVAVVGMGTLAVGAVLMVIQQLVNPAFFRGETLPKQVWGGTTSSFVEGPLAVPAGLAAGVASVELGPDSGVPDRVAVV
ncbi:APC family permease [Propionibacterium freudenreichii]|uniref:APC family permease n=1 Tax=Propionibacterium freudenreichii TaxID=1744 RepID=UPI00254EA0D1|nr:APC family permease [Propionibacterium freudenreichii]MDK9353539.1 APC family permease [Propionibacterium freudenreichii]